MEGSHFCPKCSGRKDEIGVETLMLELGETFYEDSSSTDWAKRKEALDKLQKVLQSNQLLKDGDYRPLLDYLRRIIISDLCVIVVGLAVQCVTSLAKKLGKQFGKYAEGMCLMMFEKFVEKRQKMTELLREAVDTIFETARLESLQNTIIRFLKHPNPSIRYEIILFLARNFPKCNKRVLSNLQFQPLFHSLKSLVTDGDIVIREKTLATLGVAAQVAGEKAILPYIRDLDLASRAKIEVYQMRAWETVKTYNEVKFPNFIEKPRKPEISECPLSLSTLSEIDMFLKEEVSKIEESDLTSTKSMNMDLILGFGLDSGKQSSEATTNLALKDISNLLTKNISTITEDNKTEKRTCKLEKKELSLPTACELHDSPDHEPFNLLSRSITGVEVGNSSNVNQNDNKITIRKFTNKCLTDLAHYITEMTGRNRLITYKEPTTEKINEMDGQKTEDTKFIGPVHVEPETEVEESQVSFTKTELNELLHILTAASFRARAREKEGSKKKSHTKKQHRYTAMSRGFLGKTFKDHKEIQCTSAACLEDKPTQTLLTRENPTSVSCIVNCCEKCTRLLMAKAPANSNYIFPVNTGLRNPHLPADESSDNTVYRELVSYNRMRPKTESDLTKNTTEKDLVSKEKTDKLLHNREILRSYDIKNFVTLHNVDVHGKLNKSQNIFRRTVAIDKSSTISNIQPTEHGKKPNSKYRDKKIYFRKGKVSTCNKTTFVTTTSQRKRKKRKKNNSTYARLDDLTEDRKDFLANEVYKGESKRAMKVRVIRIE